MTGTDAERQLAVAFETNNTMVKLTLPIKDAGSRFIIDKALQRNQEIGTFVEGRERRLKATFFFFYCSSQEACCWRQVRRYNFFFFPCCLAFEFVLVFHSWCLLPGSVGRMGL